jgi:Family of unknown function (DUF6049)
MPRPLLTGCAATAIAASVLALAGLASRGSMASAATAQPDQTPLVSLAITSVSPAWARPGRPVTVTGTLTNDSATALHGMSVQLGSSSVAIGSRNELQEYADGSVQLAVAITGAVTGLPSTVAPRHTVGWTVTLRPGQVPLTGFGVYPLAADAESPVFGQLAEDRTFLPYWPGKRSLDPQPQQIAWVWPLIDQPRQAMCAGQLLNNGLAASLASGGRLSGLLAAARQYATSAQLTWAVDPALLANVTTMTKPYVVVSDGAGCGGTVERASPAAQSWLAQLKAATAGQPMFVTPYADADIAALTRYGMNADLTRAFTEGRSVASSVLDRDFAASAPGGTTNLTGMAWPADGIANYGVLENLAASDGITTVVLDSSTMPPSPQQNFTPSAQTTTPDGEGSELKVLLSDDTLTQIIASANSPSDSKATAFAVAQRYLAETAMIAAEQPSLARSIVVTPPRRWDPPAGLASDLLSETVGAPWLRPVSLGDLAAEPHPAGQVTRQAPDAVSNAELGPSLLAQARQLDQQVKLLQGIQQAPDPNLDYGVAAVESGAWRGGSLQGSAQAQQFSRYLSGQEAELTIGGPKRVTLAGLKGGVPVSISNGLGYTVRVKLEAGPSTGITVKGQPPLLVIPPGQQQIKKVEVAAAGVGLAKLRLRLVTPEGAPLSAQVTVYIQATHYGTLALVIIGTALGIFVLTSVTRAVRRRRKQPRAGSSGPDPGPAPGPQDAGPGPREASPAPQDAAPGPQDAGPGPREASPAPQDAGPGSQATARDERDWRGDRGEADNVVTGGSASGHAPAHDAAEETDDYAWAPGRADPR